MDSDNQSCRHFSLDSTSSTQSDRPQTTNKKKVKKTPGKPESEVQISPPCSDIITSSSSSSTTISMRALDSDSRVPKPTTVEAPNIGYELNIAKSVLQQYSTLSGDNLFDHLSDIVKRVIDERPPNVIDFFEEFSRNVREQKFHVPERFPPNGVFADCRMFRPAKRILGAIKLPTNVEHDFGADEDLGEEAVIYADTELQIDLDDSLRMFVTFNERVEQLQFYWNQAGFSISKNDIFQLASSINRLQTHPSIMQCRFWGCLYGLKSSYYIVEASLTRDEMLSRLNMMEEEMREKQLPLKMRKNQEYKPKPAHIGPELTPGIYGWENIDPDDLAKMTPKAEPVPLAEEIEFYDIPPEFIGRGCNRFSYFVVNSLYDDWIELPIVTPRQIIVSRHIKKFFTGDLEADVVSYPCFPGKEKHYLRAMIARISAGTHIAPQGYYRRMTKKEKDLYDGINMDEMEEEGEEEENYNEGEEDQLPDNDVMLMKNERFEIEPLSTLATPIAWVHCRPNILNQGRIVWFDEEKASKERERALTLYLKMRLMEEMEEEAEEEEAEAEEEGDEEEMLTGFIHAEIGPDILSSCGNDMNTECPSPWLVRFTSKYTNLKERLLIMQSNLWPGAFTFLFENTCESIYLGWGHKFCRRNIPFNHLPKVQEEFPHGSEDFIESTDPSVEDELAYNEWLLNKQKRPTELGEDGNEYDMGEDDDQYGDDDD
ncbi:radial spoke head protein 4 homolog A [Drosophila sulfurigaster albostrigata]|uniref:radial spoke head protein 4 homolog A n=1 Tax=Drosophila sulfurigaster albostrigata TaxID=89887 RepID=UPI002D21EB0B|nr:radial spoke head protein 4 homolog A [Drosophila sulfurigaster albostrigata]